MPAPDLSELSQPPQQAHQAHQSSKGRVVFLIRVPLERQQAFLEAYEKIRHEVAAGVDGHLVDQVCQSAEDPEQWLITSEWERLEAFRSWETSPDHRELVKPMRACFTDARSLKFNVVAQTGYEPR